MSSPSHPPVPPRDLGKGGTRGRTEVPQADGSCANCGAVLTGRYCASCGQEASRDLRVRAVLRDALADVVDLDGRIWSTLRHLLTTPGALSASYLAGQRVRFVGPLRLYLLSSVLFFAALELAPIPAVARISFDDAPPAANVQREPVVQDGAVTPSGAAPEAQLPPPVAATSGRTTIWQRMARAAQDPERLNRAFLRGSAWAMFLLIPLFALLLRLVWPRRQLLYAHHVVFALHVHAFAFLCMAAALAMMHVTRLAGSAGIAVPAGAAAAANTLYLVLAARRFYGDGIVSVVLRLVPVAVAYWGAVVAASLTILGLVLLLF